MGKKGKGKKGPKEPLPLLAEVEREMFQLHINDITRKLERITAQCLELEKSNEEYEKKYKKLDEDRGDIITYLKRTLQEKSDEAKQLQETVDQLTLEKTTMQENFAAKIAQMEHEFKVMQEQLTGDIKLLSRWTIYIFKPMKFQSHISNFSIKALYQSVTSHSSNKINCNTKIKDINNSKKSNHLLHIFVVGGVVGIGTEVIFSRLATSSTELRIKLNQRHIQKCQPPVPTVHWIPVLKKLLFVILYQLFLKIKAKCYIFSKLFIKTNFIVCIQTAGRLKALEHFRVHQDELMNKFKQQEIEIEEREKEHKRMLYEVEKKFIIAKDKAMKDMEVRQLQLSSEFEATTQMCIAASTKRAIRENIAVNNELRKVQETTYRLIKENEKLKEHDRHMKIQKELTEEEKNIVMQENAEHLKARVQFQVFFLCNV
ncbi:uncharacterized protein LOC124795781 [Schistocerca piceifrons]|uniref:uncharacterized protein LOC124795781 n=1 Tax=Schistocerca piceifrons TaxID=274613 RepID=UPI001F5FA648|nr:uncharacterized protein LOC124795781 [Schistocerca piceifrons]